MASEIAKSGDYADWLGELKGDIAASRTRAAQSVNRELILLYWRIGHSILDKQARLGWGAKVIDLLAADLRRAFPELRGLSPRNLKYMRAFAAAYPDRQFVQEVLAQITWYHNISLLDKVKDPTERAFYVKETIASGWSRNVLVM
ncbi:MAG: DUF1016 N-terminal domain-containing protein, partial [Blastocatellia bacterium]